MVEIVKQDYKQNKKRYEKVYKQLQKNIKNNVIISHVGSTAIPNIYGKNIIDVLIGVEDYKSLNEVSKKVEELGYFPGKNKEKNYRFFASTQEETKSKDIHIHICIISTSRYQEFLLLKRYLLLNEDVALKYSDYKKEIINKKSALRSEYKKIKSKYVEKLINQAKEYNNKLPKSIILVRHGENIFNDNIPNDLLELSALGIKQAMWVKERLNNNFDVVFSSTSKRTIDTASIISPKIKAIQDERLLEKGYGNHKHGDETLKEAETRFKEVLDEVIKKYPNKKILFVIHGALMKLAQDVIEGENLKRDPIDNCEIIKYERTSDEVFNKNIEKPFE